MMTAVPCNLVARCRVPADPAAVTVRRADAEVDPRSVGVEPDAVERVWGAVERLYRGGMHPAVQLCVRRRGQVLIDRAIGHARGNAPDDPPGTPMIPVTPDTPVCIYSASKALTAMVIHLLDQWNLLRLDDPVCEYLPEFASGSKQFITIRHVLVHRAGIPNLPPAMMNLDLLDRPDEIVSILSQLPQMWRPGRQLAYHAITGGFILAQIVRRVTGKPIRALVDDELCRPFGFRWMNYGVAPEDEAAVARCALTGPPPLPPLSWMFERALGIDVERLVELTNEPRFLTSVVPSGNVVATATDLSRFFQLLLNGGTLDGRQLFEPRTVRRAVAEQSYLEIDFTLALPFRYGMGFMLGADWFSLYGPDTRSAFGHLGFTNVIGWADPTRDVAGALITTGKPLIYLGLLDLWDVLRQIGLACPKGRSPTWLRPGA